MRGCRSLYICFPSRQEAAQEKKPKRREKLKRRGQAEGEQAQPEQSGLGELEPPLPKKTKEAKEKGDGLAGESGGSEHVVKPSAAVSNGVTPPGEQENDAEVGTLRVLPN